MAADLHIHVFDDDMVKQSYITMHRHSLGSKFFDLTVRQPHSDWSHAADRVSATPNVWVGEVSWLEANLTEDPETFVPSTVEKVAEIIGEEFPVVDDALIEKIAHAMDLDNKTAYRLAKANEVIDFLKEHRGKKAFTISW